MRASVPWKQWTGRVLQLGMSRLALALGILFVVLAVANPLWSLRVDPGGGAWATSAYGRTAVTTEEFEGGNWKRTVIESYSSLDLNQPNIAGAMGASYLLALVYLIVLVAVILLFSMERTRTMAPLALLILSLLVVIVSLLALFYPIIGVQNAAPNDPPLTLLGISGFWGTGTSDGNAISWGAALGWWFLVVAVILGIVGVALPYMKSVRAMGAPRPQSWTPRR